MSLIDRLRDAVLRLIMISALSKVSSTTNTATYDGQSPMRLSSRSSLKSSPVVLATTRRQRDSHHTEAVADCIEFIKRSANVEKKSSSVYDKNADQIVVPLPVM
ncbi:hypothetical protein QVD17_18869 [Tagetes erecta]|uniref:Uncharacterized protein n=1 Tax=Tagetes erecta TaxID=13708 RepID=A0AAD8KPY3_TARER|nr:hypothetical protein QVD17_18869 [Tagetes erecta]